MKLTVTDVALLCCTLLITGGRTTSVLWGGNKLHSGSMEFTKEF